MNTTEDNKDVKLLKNELWIKQVGTKAEVVVIRENYITRRNQKKLNKRTRNSKEIGRR